MHAMNKSNIERIVIAITAIALIFGVAAIGTSRWIVVFRPDPQASFLPDHMSGDESYSIGLFSNFYKNDAISRNRFRTNFRFSIGKDEAFNAVAALMLGSLSFLSVGLVFVVVNQINCRSNQPSTKALKVAFVILSFAVVMLFAGMVIVSANRKVVQDVISYSHHEPDVGSARHLWSVETGSVGWDVGSTTPNSGAFNSSGSINNFYKDLVTAFGARGREKQQIHLKDVHCLKFGLSYMLGWISFFSASLSAMLSLIAVLTRKHDALSEKAASVSYQANGV